MKRDWRDTISVASDVALVGLAVTAASVPLVTAGAAVRAGSAAVRAIAAGEGVNARGVWRLFRASLLPGALGTAVVGAGALLLLFNVGAVASGRVPGGPAALAGTGVAAAVLLAIGMLGVVRLGTVDLHTIQAGGKVPGWREAFTWAARTAWRHPGAAAAVAGASAVAAALAMMVPLTAPLLVGYALYGAHVLTARLVRSPQPRTVS
jgi:hypothetical protein